jgi:hypothetical protein
MVIQPVMAKVFSLIAGGDSVAMAVFSHNMAVFNHQS